MRKNIIIALIVAWAFTFGFQIGSIYETMQEINAIRAALEKRSEIVPDQNQNWGAMCAQDANGDITCNVDGRKGHIVLEPITR